MKISYSERSFIQVGPIGSIALAAVGVGFSVGAPPPISPISPIPLKRLARGIRMSQPSFVLLVGVIMVLSTFGIWSVFSHKVDESLKNMQITQQGKRQEAYSGEPAVNQFPDNGGWNPYRTYRLPQDGTADGVYQGHPGGGGSSKSKERSCYLGRDESVLFFPCKAEKLGPRFLPWNTSVIETPELPSSSRLFPEIGNGHVATVVRSKSIFMNGLYNGANVTSHRARIPSTAAVIVKIASPSSNVTTVFRLDVGRGVFSEVYRGSGFTVEVRRYAHRELRCLLVTEVVVERGNSTLPIVLSFSVDRGNDSEDIDFALEKQGLWMGKTKEAEYPERQGTTPVTMIYSVVPPFLTYGPSIQGSAAFLTSVSPFKVEALEHFVEGKLRFRKGTLFASHVSAWETLWQQGRIEMKGNDSLALATNTAMYYLLTALPLKADAHWPFVGMAPGGLGHGERGRDYLGHVFWDQDTWMFPPMMLLHGDIGRLIVGSRLRTLDAAMAYAQKTGLKGARYPWESGFTGFPVSPSYDTRTYEIHVTGDAAWMMRQYLQLTNDTGFLTQAHGYKALSEIADFWVSRSIYNKTKRLYEIRDVMGPDEYHNRVDNSVYTNMIAVQSLRSAQYAAALAGQTPKVEWETVASSMYVNFDPKYNYHPEFDNYTRGTVVKQADVVLLGFPFMWPMPEAVFRNDLIYYATVTPGGPAMTWSIFAIGWLQLGERGKAEEAFHNSTRNIQEPFKVWSENADGSGAYNFHTGMGGYLQSLLYGYLGVNLFNDHIDLDPQLPPSLTAMAARGVDYVGGSLDIEYDASQMKVTLTQAARVPLCLIFKGKTQKVDLKVGSTVTLDRQMAMISPQPHV